MLSTLGSLPVFSTLHSSCMEGGVEICVRFSYLPLPGFLKEEGAVWEGGQGLGSENSFLWPLNQNGKCKAPSALQIFHCLWWRKEQDGSFLCVDSLNEAGNAEGDGSNSSMFCIFCFDSRAHMEEVRERGTQVLYTRQQCWWGRAQILDYLRQPSSFSWPRELQPQLNEFCLPRELYTWATHPLYSVELSLLYSMGLTPQKVFEIATLMAINWDKWMGTSSPF